MMRASYLRIHRSITDSLWFTDLPDVLFIYIYIYFTKSNLVVVPCTYNKPHLNVLGARSCSLVVWYSVLHAGWSKCLLWSTNMSRIEVLMITSAWKQMNLCRVSWLFRILMRRIRVNVISFYTTIPQENCTEQTHLASIFARNCLQPAYLEFRVEIDFNIWREELRQIMGVRKMFDKRAKINTKQTYCLSSFLFLPPSTALHIDLKRHLSVSKN